MQWGALAASMVRPTPALLTVTKLCPALTWAMGWGVAGDRSHTTVPPFRELIAQGEAERKTQTQGVVCWPIVPELERLKQEDSCRFKASLGYKVRSWLKR